MPPSRARGTRDYLPAQMHERRFVLETIARIYRDHGFEPLDTPAFERIDTLMGKYGEEGDKLVFKILKRGEGEKTGQADLALRYDLTVPLARVVANHQGQLRYPFRRYHMGPVWRADRPGRGRFREFWQCDVDIVGAQSTLAEAECLAVMSRAVAALGFPDLVLRLNDRRLLRAMARQLGVEGREGDLLVALDKLDKIGVDGVNKELEGRGLGHVIDGLWPLVQLEGDAEAKLAAMESALSEQPETADAVADLRQVMADAATLGASNVDIDPTLARGLDYYTGPIWEGVLPGANMGTVCSGGRYDGLIGMFSGNALPAVGGSIGVERLLVLREEKGLAVQGTSAPVLVLIYNSDTRSQSIEAVRLLREAGIGADLFTEKRKFDKQIKYARARGYPWILKIRSSESDAGTAQIERLADRDQFTGTLPQIIEHLKTDGAV